MTDALPKFSPPRLAPGAARANVRAERDPPANTGPRRVALLLALATFPLIFLGGLVTSHGAGMSVPDWPNSYGYNMFLFPPNQWVGGILYEHAHRLMGTIVGFLAILLAARAYGPSARPAFRQAMGLLATGCALSAIGIVVWLLVRHPAGRPAVSLRSNAMHAVVGLAAIAAVAIVLWTARRPDPRRWVRRLCLGVLGAVIFQGILGGLRVVWINLDLAVVHGCFAQAFFCLTALAAVVTSAWWQDAPDLSAAKDAAAGRRFLKLAVVAVAVIYGQLVVGAVMRHYRAGLAIPDFPLAFGHVIPPTDAQTLAPAAAALQGDAAAAQTLYGPPGSIYARWMNRWPAWNLDAAELTPVKVWLQFAHRIGALLVAGVLLLLASKVFKLHRGRTLLVGPAALILLLLLTQVTLGMLTVLLRKPADVASAHVAVGALTLVTTFVLAVRSSRLYSPRPAVRPQGRRAFEVMPVPRGPAIPSAGEPAW